MSIYVFTGMNEQKWVGVFISSEQKARKRDCGIDSEVSKRRAQKCCELPNFIQYKQYKEKA